MRKTGRTIALLAAGLLTLTACGGGDTTAPAGDAGGDTAGGEPVEITYLHRLPDGEGMTPVADIVARWNEENPDIQVTATKFDGRAAEMIMKLENDIRAGTGPCLAQLSYTEVPNMFSKGLVEDVTEQAEQYADHYADGAYSMMTVGEQVVGLPQDTGPLVYFYNAAEFERLGIEVPTTAEEFVEAARTAEADGKYIADFQPDEAQNWLAGQAAGAGATWYVPEDDQWRVQVTGSETQQVADMWQTLLDDDLVLTHNRWDDTFTAALVDGELIGTIGAAWETPLLAGDMQGSPGDGQWAVAQLPQFGDEEMTGPDGGSGVAVMSGCEAPEQAMQFNDWFNTQIDDLVSQGLVVAAEGEMTTPEDIQSFYGGQDVFAELSTANSRLNPDFGYMPTFPAIADSMVTAAAAAASGEGQVSDVFEAAQSESVSSLEAAGMPVTE